MDHRTILCSYCNKPLQVKGDNSEQTVTCSLCGTQTKVPALSTSVEELDFYDLDKPYSFISILKEKETLKKRYIVLEPVLSSDDHEILSFLKETMVKTLNVRLDELGEKAESYLINAVEEILQKYEIVVDGVSWEKILYYLKKRFLGYDDIDPLMQDPYIEDISCDGAKVPLFVYQRQFGSLETNVKFSHDELLAKFVVKLAQKCGKHISVSDPMLDATMPDGSRIQMTLRGEVTTRGSTFTIRKFRADPITPVDLIEYETFSTKMIAYLWLAVEHGFNALISGGTASGKTSTLNALALFIPRESKIVSIEETREINLPHPNWIPGVTRSGFGEVVNDRMVGEIDLFDLMKAALRQRPEYILVGEIRGREAYVLFQAMATGHTTYSTVHADSTQALIHRLEGKPINIPRTMLQSLDIVLLMRNQKTQDKQQRRCIKIVELLNVDSETTEVLTNSVFEWDPQQSHFSYTGKSYVLEQIRSQIDMTTQDMSTELRQRADILNWMQKYHIREFTDVSNILAKYAETPEKVLELITKEPEKIDKEIKESLFTIKSNYESLLDNPDVVKRNEKAKEIEKAKQEKNSIFGSIFSKKQNEKKLISREEQTPSQTEPPKNDSNQDKTAKQVKQKKSGLPELNQRISYAKKNPASYFSKAKENIDSSSNKEEFIGAETAEEEKEIEFFYDNTKDDTYQKEKQKEVVSKLEEEIDQTLKKQSTPSSQKNKKTHSQTKSSPSNQENKPREPKHKKKETRKVPKEPTKPKKGRIEKLAKTRIRINKEKIKSKLKFKK